MIDKTEHNELIGTIEISNKIPKLFLRNYGDPISGSGLFRFGIYEKEKEEELENRFANLCLSEKFFYYLRDGLEQDKKIYDERRLKIAKSEHAEALKTPLLLIFEHEKFKSAPVKTPELYFDIYKEVISSKIINQENFNLNTITSLLKSDKKTYGKYQKKLHSKGKRKEKLDKILDSLNLAHCDFVYMYFYLQPDNFFKSMYQFTDKSNPYFSWLFQSDLTSQFLDYVFQFHEEKSYDLVQRIISANSTSGLHYISNWEFENGVELIAWFKAFMYHVKKQSLEKYIDKKIAFKDFPFFKGKFVTCDIFRSEILAMLPNTIESTLPAIEDSLVSVNPSEKVNAVLNKGKQLTSTKIPPVFTGISRIDSLLTSNPSSVMRNDFETLTEKNRTLLSSPGKFFFKSTSISPKVRGGKDRALSGSSKKSSEPIIGSSLQENQGSSKRKKQKASTQEAQMFLDYPKKFFGLNINPALKSTQVLEREYAPISGDCWDLMTNKEISILNVSSPEYKYLSQCTLPKTNEEIQAKDHSAFSVKKMQSEKAQRETDCVTALLDLSSKSEYNPKLLLAENKKYTNLEERNTFLETHSQSSFRK